MITQEGRFSRRSFFGVLLGMAASAALPLPVGVRKLLVGVRKPKWPFVLNMDSPLAEGLVSFDPLDPSTRWDLYKDLGRQIFYLPFNKERDNADTSTCPILCHPPDWELVDEKDDEGASHLG